MPHRTTCPTPNDLPGVSTRNRIARQLAADLASTGCPASHLPAGTCQALTAALADTPALAAEITQLRAELAATRLGHANLAAAALATVAADEDGEADPLCYLRDELRAQGHVPARWCR